LRAQRCADLERISASASRLEKELAGKTDELKTASNQLHVCDFSLDLLIRLIRNYHFLIVLLL